MATTFEFRDIARFILANSGGAAFERYDGTLCPVSLDLPGSTFRDIVDAEIAVDDSGVAKWNQGYTGMGRIITRIDLYYQPILPLKGGWAKIYCQRVGGSGEINNFGSDGATYSGYLQEAYDIVNEDRPLTIYANGIRDAATAEKLAKLYILWRFMPLKLLSVTGTYSLLDIELLDKVGVDCSFLPAHYVGKKWLVVGHRVVPSVGAMPGVELKLIQIGGDQIADDLVLQDTWATGDSLADTWATGTNYVEVWA